MVRQSPVPMSLVKEKSLDITGAKKIYQITMTCGYDIFVSLGSITSAMSEFALPVTTSGIGYMINRIMPPTRCPSLTPQNL